MQAAKALGALAPRARTHTRTRASATLRALLVLLRAVRVVHLGSHGEAPPEIPGGRVLGAPESLRASIEHTRA